MESTIILKGKKQVENAFICIECINILNKLGHDVSEASIREGLKTVVHRARMETLNEEPLIIYDGAHNEPAIKNLQSMVDMYYKDRKRVYIISILKRKDYEKMLRILLQDEDAEFIFTTGNNVNRYTLSEELYTVALKYKKNQVFMQKTLDEAIEYAMKNDNSKVNFVVGSFYVYGNVVNKINEIKK